MKDEKMDNLKGYQGKKNGNQAPPTSKEISSSPFNKSEQDITEIVQLRMANNTAINDFNRIFLDNKYMLMMVYTLLEAVETTKSPICDKALLEFNKLWAESGRPGIHTTQHKKVKE